MNVLSKFMSKLRSPSKRPTSRRRETVRAIAMPVAQVIPVMSPSIALRSKGEPLAKKSKPSPRVRAKKPPTGRQRGRPRFNPQPVVVSDGLLAIEEAPQDQVAVAAKSEVAKPIQNGVDIAQENVDMKPSRAELCEICSLQRPLHLNHGQMTCAMCYQFFRKFLQRSPSFVCADGGECALDCEKKCEACWIKKCIHVFTIKYKRQQVLLSVTSNESDN